MNQAAAGMETLDIENQYAGVTGVFNELVDDQTIRPHWQNVIRGLESLGLSGVEGRRVQADSLLHEHGVTFNAFGGNSRPWQLDIFPLAIASAEWRKVEQGIAQRARLLDFILRDLYGPRELVRKGFIPREAVFGNPLYQQAFRNLVDHETRLLHLYSVELARSGDGQWWCMADRTNRTYGLGYALENRVVLSRSVPNLIQRCRVERLAPFFMQVRETLAGLAQRATEFPRVVVLSEGPSSPVYFEDQYLAQYLGYTLVEGGDLAVRNDNVAMKTLDGLLPVDVILRRAPEQFLDPLELGGAAAHGVSGLMHAIRKKTIAVANMPGTGLFESPMLMPFLPGICQEYFSEELQLPSIATWWCKSEKARKYVLEHFDDLVVKPAFRYSGSEEYIVSEMSSSERATLKDNILARPSEFVAQEKVTRSSAPIWHNNKVGCGHVGLRAFAVSAGENFEVMPGALVRVAADSGPMELSIVAGDSSKDAWIVSDKPVERVSLLGSSNSTIPLVRSETQLPSRVADNLFWLGRHLDRAETSARLLRAISERLAGEGGFEDAPELTALLRVLAAEGQIEPGLAVEGLSGRLPTVEEVLPGSVFDENEQTSLRSTINEFARLATVVRDQISHDTWRTISRIDADFRPDIEAGETSLADALDQLDSLIIGLAACSGLITDGHVRGPAWRFLDMGRRIERSFRTISLLQHSLCENPFQGNQIRAILESLLDVVDCRSTYRIRYLAGARLVPVVDLLVTDETNPRSIGHQLAVLSKHVDALPRMNRVAKLSRPQKYIRTALHELRLVDLDELCQSEDDRFKNMNQFFESIEELLTDLSNDITRRFLVHSGTPRQIVEDDHLMDHS